MSFPFTTTMLTNNHNIQELINDVNQLKQDVESNSLDIIELKSTVDNNYESLRNLIYQKSPFLIDNNLILEFKIDDNYSYYYSFLTHNFYKISNLVAATLILTDYVTNLEIPDFLITDDIPNINITINFLDFLDSNKNYLQFCERVRVPNSWSNLLTPFLFKDNISLTEIFFPINYHFLSNNLFYNSRALNKVTLTNISSIGDNCFEGCTSLKQLTIPPNCYIIGNFAYKDS